MGRQPESHTTNTDEFSSFATSGGNNELTSEQCVCPSNALVVQAMKYNAALCAGDKVDFIIWGFCATACC